MPHLKETLTKEARQEISRLTAELNQELLKAVKRLNPDYTRERKMRAELGFFSQNLATNLNNLTNLAGPLPAPAEDPPAGPGHPAAGHYAPEDFDPAEYYGGP